MSLLGKNILNDLVKPNGNKSLINSSNIVNNSGKYSNVSFNSLKTKINKTPLYKEFAPANLMYFLQTAFNGNYGFLGFAFLQYFIDKDNPTKPTAQEIYDKYFKNPEKVKEIISYYTDFYNAFLEEITKETYTGPEQNLKDLKPFINDLKTKYNKTYFQIIPFYLLQFINIQDFKFDTAIGKKIKELVINQDFKEKCIQLYQIYNQNNSQELTEGLFPYLKNNISFQVLISNMGFNKIGKGIGDDIWIYKTENSAGILTSNRINKDAQKIKEFFQINLGITEEEDYQNITEEEYGLLKSYYNFLEKQISDTESSKNKIIVFLLKKQVERLNEIKVTKSIVGVDILSQVGGTSLNPKKYEPLLNTDRLEIVLQNTNANSKESVLKTILIKMIILAEKESGKANTELKEIEKKLIKQDSKNLKKNYLFLKFNSFYEGIDRFIKSLSNPSKGDWVKCQSNCETLANKYIGFETKTTLYYLTFLAKSLIEDKEKLKLVFTGPNNRLTGFWKDDMKLFKLDSEQFNTEKGKLIMGFGPSASGKTYWAKNIIKILNQTEPTFPTNFLSIDGGIMREVSLTYQMLKNLAKTEVKGFENLGGGLFSPLFNTDKIKGQVLEFLKQSKQPKPNLYVPHTLAECSFSFGIKGKQYPICRNQYQRYIDITKDDKWTGLMIYQHLTQKQCPYKDLYKCKGCKESGEEREVEEGKKYSSSSWKTAYEYGMQQYKKAGGYKILIHNNGREGYYSLIYSSDLKLDEKILEDYKIRKCENEICDTFIDKDLIIFEEKIIRFGEEQIPYTRGKNTYEFTLNGNQYEFKLKGDEVSFYKGEKNILRFTNQNFIKVPINPGTNMERLNMNELLLLVIFSLMK